jgi:hypothetical protein
MRVSRQFLKRVDRRRKASTMAGHAIDGLTDKTAPGAEQARRKKRLLQGPEEFREMRQKIRKAK